MTKVRTTAAFARKPRGTGRELRASVAAVPIPALGEASLCLHCGLPVEALETAPFCCVGCRAVHELLTTEHLDRYYELRGPRGVPVADPSGPRRDSKWIDSIDEARRAVPGTCRVDLDVQGIHCSACVWLMEKLFDRQCGGAGLTVNPAIGRVQLLVDQAFDLRRFVGEVERFGYSFGPPRKDAVARRSSDLVWRMGVCIAIAMNTMIFAVATYAGLHDGTLYDAFLRINLALSAVAVAVGGSVFVRSAWQGLRRGYLHLDLPISIGIVLAFGGSVYAYLTHRGSGIFVDTLDVFIALMLVGRWLQERVLERNRLTLLQSDGTDGLLARRLRGDRVETVRCAELRTGDRLLVAPGDLVPAAARIEDDGPRSFSLDWINGECSPRAFDPRARVPAGAFLADDAPATVTLLEDFDRSPLVELLRTPAPRAGDAAMSTPWWSRLTKIYVSAVLIAAAVGFAGWWIATRDLGKSLEVTTALLVVTCPCAFGIATPLGYDLVLAGLRRAGLFVRSPGFLDRATRIRKVVFDKTGTLTKGTLVLVNPEILDRLDAEQRRMLATAAAGSSHPKSAPVLRHLSDVAIEPRARVVVHPEGVSVHHDGREYRLGRGSWVSEAAAALGDADIGFGIDGQLLASLSTEEALRPDARREVTQLTEGGYEVWLLSGDSAPRVERAARNAGISPARAIGSRSAQEKQAWVAEHDQGDLLMIGDGVNDSLVVASATCGGTPTIERPFLAARSDFYFVTPGLGPVRLALRAALQMARVRRRNLTLAVAYNVLTVALAYAGFMSPLACAVLMPLSSLTTVLFTIGSLSPRSSLWKSSFSRSS